MRIVHGIFTDGFFGSERYVVDLANRQSAAGHDVHVMLRPDSIIPRVATIAGTVHTPGWLTRRFGMQGLIDTLAPDILHAHLGRACVAFASARRRPPLIATLHIDYRASRHAKLDGLIALTEAQLGRASSYGGAIEKISNWIPATTPATPADGLALRRELDIAPDDFVVGFCGRLHAVKDPALLVKAFLAAWRPGMVLVMAGEGKLEADLKDLAGGHPAIKLIGYRTDVARLYQAFDLFVLASRSEPFGLVLLEAMQAGAPVAATRTDGPLEVLPVPPCRLFDAGDEAALAEILREAAAGSRQRIKYDLSAFDPVNQTEKILAFYERIRSLPSDKSKEGV